MRKRGKCKVCERSGEIHSVFERCDLCMEDLEQEIRGSSHEERVYIGQSEESIWRSKMWASFIIGAWVGAILVARVM